MNRIIAIYKGLTYTEFRVVLVKLLFSVKNDKAQHLLKVNYSLMFTRFSKFFNVKVEFKMHQFKFFLNLCDWFLENKSGINFLGLKTKLTLICNIAKGLM